MRGLRTSDKTTNSINSIIYLAGKQVLKCTRVDTSSIRIAIVESSSTVVAGLTRNCTVTHKVPETVTTTVDERPHLFLNELRKYGQNR